MKYKKIKSLFALLAIVIASYAHAPADSITETIIRQQVNAQVSKNFLNEQQGKTAQNSYVINVKLDMLMPPNQELMRQIIPKDANGASYGSYLLTDAEVTSLDNKLKEINNLVVITTTTGGVVVENKGVQFYVILINNLPINIERNVPDFLTLSEVLTKGKTILENVAVTNGADKTVLADIPKTPPEGLIKASGWLNRIIGEEIKKSACHWYSQNPNIAAGSKLLAPIYTVNIVNYKVYKNFTNNPTNALNPYTGLSTDYYFLLHATWDTKTDCNPSKQNDLEDRTASISEGFQNFFKSNRNWVSPVKTADNKVDMKPALDAMVSWMLKAKEQYKLMYIFAGAGEVDALINNTYNCITRINNGNQQFTCLDCGVTPNAQEPHGTTLYILLRDLNTEGYSKLTKEQKFKILKCLAAPDDNNYSNNDANIITGEFGEKQLTEVITKLLLSVNSKEEAAAFIDFLQNQTNELAKQNTSSKMLARIDKLIKNDQLNGAGTINGEMYMYNYHNAIVRLLYLANPEIRESGYYSNIDTADFRKRLFIYDPVFSKFGSSVPPNFTLNYELYNVGTDVYFSNIAFNKDNAKVTATRHFLERYDIDGMGFTFIGGGYDGLNNVFKAPIKIYTSKPVFTDEPVTLNAFDVIYFVAKTESSNNIVGNFAAQNANKGFKLFAAPAYFLKYPTEIKHSIEVAKDNENWELTKGIAIDIASFFLPEIKLGKLAFLGEAGTVIVKKSLSAYRYLLKAGAVTGATLKALAYTDVGSGDIKYANCVDSYNALLGLGYLGLDGLNSMVVRRMVAGEAEIFRASAGKFVRDVHAPGVYDDFRGFLSNPTNNGANVGAGMYDLAKSLEAAGVQLYGFSKGWAFEAQTLPAMGEGFNGIYRTNFFLAESRAAGTGFNLMSKAGNAAAELVAFGETSNPNIVNLVKSETVIPVWADKFRLVKNVRIKLASGVETVKDLMLGKGSGGACILENYCFAGNILLHTPTGTVPFGKLKEGDSILTHDETTGKDYYTQAGKVTESKAAKLVKLFCKNEVIMATPEHPLYEKTRGWTLAGKFKKGMQFVLAGGMALLVDSVAIADTACMVYNCEVPVTHTYYIGGNRILAHNANGCDKLVQAVMDRLGKGYDEVKVALEAVATKYKQAYPSLSEEDALTALTKLCSEKIQETQLKNLLGYLYTDAKQATFVAELKQYGLLDDFAKEGKLLDNYIAVKTGDYSNYSKLAGDVKNLYKGYNNLLKAIGAAMPNTLATKLGANASLLKSWTSSRQLKYFGQSGGVAEAEMFVDVEKAIGDKNVISALVDAQKRMLIQCERGTNTNKVVSVEIKIGNDNVVYTYAPSYKPSANINVDVDLSANLLAPDYITKGGQYLYPSSALQPGQKNIVEITMTGDIGKDFKAANEAAKFQGFGVKAPDLNGVQYTWHHLDNFNPISGKCTMQLVEQAAHTRVMGMGHSGGVAQYKLYNGAGY